MILTQQRSPFPRAVIERLPRLKLASVRHIPQEVTALMEGVWQTAVGTGLHGKTLGVYAFGRIGCLVAAIGRAFGMQVVCWGREGSLAKAREAGFPVAASRATFFESSDIISLHIPLNKETRGLITSADLARMRASALIVNTSRAQLIEEDALVDALRQGRPGWAAIDVFEDEPVIGGRHSLLDMANVICTPHLGYVERKALESFYGGAIDSILAFAAGSPVNVLNPAAIGRRGQHFAR